MFLVSKFLMMFPFKHIVESTFHDGFRSIISFYFIVAFGNKFGENGCNNHVDAKFSGEI
jgi:hypothetical protein